MTKKLKSKVRCIGLGDDCVLYVYPKNQFNPTPFVKITTPLKKDIRIELSELKKIVRYLGNKKP